MTTRLKLYDDERDKQMIEALSAGTMANMVNSLPQPVAPHVAPRASRPTVRQ